jgi:hypothetical protein
MECVGGPAEGWALPASSQGILEESNQKLQTLDRVRTWELKAPTS